MINAKEALELTLNTIDAHEDNKRKYIAGMIKSAATSRRYSVDFDYTFDYELNNEDVAELRKLGYRVTERYKNGTSFLVSWRAESK